MIAHARVERVLVERVDQQPDQHAVATTAAIWVVVYNRNKVAAAEILGISLKTLYTKITTYDLTKD